jgi:alginate O-acetyltransferase complex protein AlgJ
VERFERSIPTHKQSAAIWAAARWALFTETSTGAVAGRDGWLFTAEEFCEPADVRDLGEELRRASAILASRSIQLIPVIVPDKARMQADRLPRARSEDFASRYDLALQMIATAKLPVIDLRPALNFGQSYMRTDTHWSPEGAQRSAEEIAAAISYIGIARASVETKANGTQVFEGDLLSFAATGAFRGIVGPAAEVIQTYETNVAAATGLFGEAVIPVALVGTSYSAKAEFHFHGFLMQALEADVLNASVVGQGPFAPMDSFLAELEQLASPPSLVIWEIPERYLTSRNQLQ